MSGSPEIPWYINEEGRLMFNDRELGETCVRKVTELCINHYQERAGEAGNKKLCSQVEEFLSTLGIHVVAKAVHRGMGLFITYEHRVH